LQAGYFGNGENFGKIRGVDRQKIKIIATSLAPLKIMA
jgi:hypothetical protein